MKGTLCSNKRKCVSLEDDTKLLSQHLSQTVEPTFWIGLIDREEIQVNETNVESVSFRAR